MVLVGGTGGLGSSLASLLIAEGSRVVLSYFRNSNRAAQWRESATTVQADLASESDRKRLLDAASSLYGLVVFTGDPARAADPAQTEAAMRQSHQVNYLGPILLVREAARRMKAASTPGSIVLLSTIRRMRYSPARPLMPLGKQHSSTRRSSWRRSAAARPISA